MAKKNRKYFFIVNPISGKGKGLEIIPMIESKFKQREDEYEIRKTESARHAITLAKEAVSNGFDVIIAVGGDGTVNEVASVVAGSSFTLGIIPIGSGNGLAREMGVPLSAKAALSKIITGDTRKIDTLECNGRFFACTSGVGFDAHLANKFLKTEKRGLAGYVKIFINEFFNYQAQEYILTIDGKEVRMKAFLITIANCRQWGNEFYISPKSKPDDGKFEVCIIHRFPLILFPVLLFRIISKSIHRSKYVETISADGLTLIGPGLKCFHTDGEITESIIPLVFTINPLSLSIVV